MFLAAFLAFLVAQVPQAVALDDGSLQWVELPVLGVAPARAQACTALYLDKLYVIGGSDNHGFAHNDVHSLDLTTLEWKELSVTGPLPKPRKAATCQRVENKVYLFGGWDLVYWPADWPAMYCLNYAIDGVPMAPGNCDPDELKLDAGNLVTQYSDTWVLDLDSLAWTELSLGHMDPGWAGSMVHMPGTNTIYFSPGSFYNQTALGFVDNADIFGLPLGADNLPSGGSPAWAMLPNNNLANETRNGRNGQSIVARPGWLTFMSGEYHFVDSQGNWQSTRKKDMWFYEIATGLWTQDTKPNYPTTYHHTALQLDDGETDSLFTAYVFGGKCNGPIFNNVAKYDYGDTGLDFEADWGFPEVSGTPPAQRYLHNMAAWGSSTAVVYGGYSEKKSFDKDLNARPYALGAAGTSKGVYWKNDAYNYEVRSDVQVMSLSTCADGCHNHGVCVLGVCSCFPGFETGPTCLGFDPTKSVVAPTLPNDAVLLTTAASFIGSWSIMLLLETVVSSFREPKLARSWAVATGIAMSLGTIYPGHLLVFSGLRFTTEGGKLLSATFDEVVVFVSLLLPLVVCLAVCLALGEGLSKSRFKMGEFREAVAKHEHARALHAFVRLFSPTVVGSTLALSLTSLCLTLILGSSITLDSVSSISKDTRTGLGVSHLLHDVSFDTGSLVLGFFVSLLLTLPSLTMILHASGGIVRMACVLVFTFGLITTPVLAVSYQTTVYNADAVLSGASLEPATINLVALLLSCALFFILVALNTLQLNMSRAFLDVAIVNLQGEKKQLTSKVESAQVLFARNAARVAFDELLLPVCDASSLLVQQRLEELILAESAGNATSILEVQESDKEAFRRMLNYPVSFKLMKHCMDTQRCHESITCYSYIMEYKVANSSRQRMMIEKDIIKLFINNDSEFQVNISQQMQSKLTKRAFGKHSLDDLTNEIERLIMNNVFSTLIKHPLYPGLLKAATAYGIHRAAKRKNKKERGSDDDVFTRAGTTNASSVVSYDETMTADGSMIPGSVASDHELAAGEQDVVVHQAQ